MLVEVEMSEVEILLLFLVLKLVLSRLIQVLSVTPAFMVLPEVISMQMVELVKDFASVIAEPLQLLKEPVITAVNI